MAGDEHTSDSTDDLTTFIITSALLAVLFLIGLYLQIKIIIVSKKDKEVTWRLDIWHSVVMIAFFTYSILFEIITYIFPLYHQYTANWFCYLDLFVKQYGIWSGSSHSLAISIYKYVLILHQRRIRVIGKDEASLIAFWINLIFPVTLAASLVARPNFAADAPISNCLRKGFTISTEGNETSGNILFGRHFFCGFDDYDDDQYGVFGHVMDVVNTGGCYITTLTRLVVLSNVMEIFVYLRIFAFMKR